MENFYITQTVFENIIQDLYSEADCITYQINGKFSAINTLAEQIEDYNLGMNNN